MSHNQGGWLGPHLERAVHLGRVHALALSLLHVNRRLLGHGQHDILFGRRPGLCCLGHVSLPAGAQKAHVRQGGGLGAMGANRRMILTSSAPLAMIATMQFASRPNGPNVRAVVGPWSMVVLMSALSL